MSASLSALNLDALQRTLTELVALDTTSARPNAPLVEYAAARLQKAGFALQRQAYRDDAGVEKVNLVAVRGGTGQERAALALVGATPETLLASVVLGAEKGAIREVAVAGRLRVSDGRHPLAEVSGRDFALLSRRLYP